MELASSWTTIQWNCPGNISKIFFSYCRLPKSHISNILPVCMTVSRFMNIWRHRQQNLIFRLEKSQRFVKEINFFFENGKNGKLRIFKGNYKIFWKFTFFKWKYATLYWPLLMALAMDDLPCLDRIWKYKVKIADSSLFSN